MNSRGTMTLMTSYYAERHHLWQVQPVSPAEQVAKAAPWDRRRSASSEFSGVANGSSDRPYGERCRVGFLNDGEGVVGPHEIGPHPALGTFRPADDRRL